MDARDTVVVAAVLPGTDDGYEKTDPCSRILAVAAAGGDAVGNGGIHAFQLNARWLMQLHEQQPLPPWQLLLLGDVYGPLVYHVCGDAYALEHLRR